MSIQDIQAGIAIHTAAAAAGGTGVFTAKIPVADHVALQAIEIGLASTLSRIYGKPVVKIAAEPVGVSCAANHVGVAVSRTAAGFIPVAGEIVNGGTAAGIVEFFGWGYVERLKH